MISGFGCYIKYLAIKSHFSNEKYDYFKYNAKVKADQNSFVRRNDRYFFERLSKRLQTHDEIEKFFVACLVKDINTWVGDVLDDSGIENYTEWKRKIESITYNFKQELEFLFEQCDDFKSLFRVKDGQHPSVLKFFLKKKISIEFLTILNVISSCFKYWDVEIQDRIVWPEIMKRCQKYQPFLIKYIGQNKIDEFRLLVKFKLGID